MQIHGFQAAQDVVSYFSSLRTSADRSSSATTPATDDTFSGERASRAKAIMAGQDLTNISYNELKALGKKLYDASVIDGDQYLNLTSPNYDRWDAQFKRISNNDEKVNALGVMHTMLDFAKKYRPSDTSSIEYLQKMVNLADSLAALSEKDNLVVNTLLHHKHD